ncbi:glycine betaine ABC transporter substrate-binding protein [Lysinibacillus sp. BW-2-10]|uniref:glycine betaine ABC transporter substrate-binding protein n=1 Tax=Lysinibacillus sp. BW-2-10 TaxID=2590030 RepID=UPI00117EBC74|nr:glycine betaine ABC transporter substrate-binding protein [Lysinibacillus sp. BW-2-10]TSI06171.1 glycine/betaine ABC transporter [Lysinibacillus sp. BW-2-10]
MSKLKTMGITAGLSVPLLLAGCGSEEETKGNETANDTQNLGEALEYTITGIEPGAGLTGLAKDTLEAYENLKGWELQESSTAGMMGALDDAIKNNEPIIITGWGPHWMFSAYDLKFLEDSKGLLGGTEDIQTLARKGLEEDMPSAYTILDRFYWEPKDVEAVMYEAQEIPFEEAAKNWVEENPDKVKEWTDGVEKVDGQEIELVTTPWDTELASSNVMKEVLEAHGYKVTITPVDPAVMFQAIAAGEGDATVAPWLPTTHNAFYEKHKDDIVDLGENLTGTQNGFVVPAYMDIDSIEDLMPKE